MFVLTNDDGIDAPGIHALAQALQALDYAAITIAPRDHQSGCGHQVTTQSPIQVTQRAESAFAVAGTPADCTRLALTHLCPEATWVISGINAGGNLGADVYISGTVAAVREAALHRIPGVALSHFIQRGRAVDWAIATTLATHTLSQILKLPLPPGRFWNVNLPHLNPGDPLPDVVFCPPCTQPLPVDYRVEGDCFHYAGNYGDRGRDRGADVEVCFSGRIAITQLQI
jgi:5'-nucleotidase